MAWGKSNETWNHTASLMTLLASIYSDPDSGRKPSIADYHPYMKRPDPAPIPADVLTAIGARFSKKKPGGAE